MNLTSCQLQQMDLETCSCSQEGGADQGGYNDVIDTLINAAFEQSRKGRVQSELFPSQTSGSILHRIVTRTVAGTTIICGIYTETIVAYESH